MEPATPKLKGPLLRFEEFALDTERGRLSRRGVPIKLQPQPLRMLHLLLARAPAMVRREELGDHIWGAGVHVDLEQNLNYCIRQIRQALEERADAPRLLETLPRQGYRFTGVVTVDGAKAEAGPQPPGVSRRHVLWALAGAGALCGGGVWLDRSLRPSARPQALDVAIPIPQGALARDPGRLLGAPAIAPDGTAIVVALQTSLGSRLFIRRLDAPRLLLMPGTEDGIDPFWSPDSRHIGFFSAGKLKRLAVAGGSALTLCDAPEPRGGSWGSAGTLLFATNFKGLYRVAESGGAPIAVTQLDPQTQENSHRYPVFLPDGDRFLYFARSDALDRRGIYLGSLSAPAGRRRVVVADGQFALGQDPHTGLYYLVSQQSGAFLAQRLDLRSGSVAGEPQKLLELTGTISLSNTGVLVARREWQYSTRLLWVDRQGRELSSVGELADYWSLRLSPDGRFVAATRHDFLSGEFRIWLAGPPGTPMEPLSEATHASRPVWSADGRTLYYTDFRRGLLLQRRIAPRGSETVVHSLPPQTYVVSLSQDEDRAALEFQQDSTHTAAAWTDFHGPHALEPRHPLETAPGGWLQPMLSPDGRWVALCSAKSGRTEIYVVDAATGSTRQRVSLEGGREPRWRADGGEIFFLAPDDRMMAATVSGRSTLRFGTPQPLFQRKLRTGDTEGPIYDVTRDGQRFLLIDDPDTAPESNLSMIINWPSRLRS